MTVPPPVIAANRVLLANLIATNFLGQNTPAIAVTEAQYAEMWAQDAGAMYTYAASSVDRRCRSPPFESLHPPPPTSDATAATKPTRLPQGQRHGRPATPHRPWRIPQWQTASRAGHRFHKRCNSFGSQRR